MSSPNKTVLITGTTSGLGLELLRFYNKQAVQIIALNREGKSPAERAIKEFPNVIFKTIDITNAMEVELLLKDLKAQLKTPDIFFLNAGINKVDNKKGLELAPFQEVLQTNLFGVLTFIEAIHKLGFEGKTIMGISSVSTIVPNSSNLGYYVSKLAMNKIFKLLSRCDSKNVYKTIILGPMHTSLNRSLPKLEGIQKKIFNFLSIEPKLAAESCAVFANSKSSVLFLPFRSVLFYFFLKIALFLKPSFYYRQY